MSYAHFTKVITANHLLEGGVVYFSPNHEWTRGLASAAVANDSTEEAALLAAADFQSGEVVGVYSIDVLMDDLGEIRPVHFRETFRTLGPSNYFHGKQAQE